MIVAAAALAAYANALPNGFVVDDVHQIVENDWITGLRHLPAIFSAGVWDFEGRASSYYRPLMYVFYMATWLVAGRSPWAYHAVNVALHAGTSVLVLAVASRLLRLDAPPLRPWLAPPFVAGLLFAVHPVHTEPVAWVAGITDVSMTGFSLLALWLYLRAEEGGRLVRPAAALCFLLATLCKETAIVLPLVLLAYEAIVGRERWNALEVAKRLVPFAATLAVYLALRIHALGGLAPTAGGVPLGGMSYTLTVLALLAGYLEKLVFPVDLNFWHAFSPPSSLASPGVARALAVVAAAVVVAWLAARRSRAAFFGAVLVVVPLFPAFNLSALNQGLENALAERYLYFPSVGFVLLAALAVDRLRDRTAPRLALPVLAVTLLAGTFAVGTVRRNPVWRDALSLWADVVRKSPGSGVARKNHGAALIYAGRGEEGERELRLAVTMRPDLVQEELGKGAAYRARGLTKKAILAVHMALALDPRSAPAHFALGALYEGRGWVAAAIREYEIALTLSPDHAEAHNDVGVLYAQQGFMEQALVHFEAAARLRPDEPGYLANLRRARGAPPRPRRRRTP